MIPLITDNRLLSHHNRLLEMILRLCAHGNVFERFSCNVFKKCRFQAVSTRKRMKMTSYDENVLNAKNVFRQAFSR